MFPDPAFARAIKEAMDCLRRLSAAQAEVRRGPGRSADGRLGIVDVSVEVVDQHLPRSLGGGPLRRGMHGDVYRTRGPALTAEGDGRSLHTGEQARRARRPLERMT